MTCAGAAGLDARRSRASTKPKLLSLRRQSGGPSGRRQRESGLARPPDRSLTPKSQTNFVWSVSPACLRAQRCKAAPVSRLWLSCCLGRHAEHRAHNAAVVAGRSLAAFGVVGCDRAVLDCLGSLQPAERMQRELASSLADAKWSAAAAKLTSQSSVAGRTVPRR